jgi:hypothetical protein
MRYGPPFRFEDRSREKQISRQNDEARLARGEVSAAQLSERNGFFSVLDRSKARLLVRRARVRTEDK